MASSSISRADVDPSDGRHETAAERSDRNWNDILQELRVTQTGTQIISGFLLTVAFQQRFGELLVWERVAYGVLVALAASCTMLGLSVVAMHRKRFRRHDKPELVGIANRLLIAVVWVVGVLTAGVVMFLFAFVFDTAAGIIAGVLAAAGVLAFLLMVPRAARMTDQY